MQIFRINQDGGGIRVGGSQDGMQTNKSNCITNI